MVGTAMTPDTTHAIGYFESVEELHRHTQSNHYFECSSCFGSFPTADKLRDHKEKKHGGLQPGEDDHTKR